LDLAGNFSEVWQGKKLDAADDGGCRLEIRRREEEKEKPGTSWPAKRRVQRRAIVQFTRNGSTILLICQVKLKYFRINELRTDSNGRVRERKHRGRVHWGRGKLRENGKNGGMSGFRGHNMKPLQGKRQKHRSEDRPLQGLVGGEVNSPLQVGGST
jgi:hypothetical protein